MLPRTTCREAQARAKAGQDVETCPNCPLQVSATPVCGCLAEVIVGPWQDKSHFLVPMMCHDESHSQCCYSDGRVQKIRAQPLLNQVFDRQCRRQKVPLLANLACTHSRPIPSAIDGLRCHVKIAYMKGPPVRTKAICCCAFTHGRVVGKNAWGMRVAKASGWESGFPASRALSLARGNSLLQRHFAIHPARAA